MKLTAQVIMYHALGNVKRIELIRLLKINKYLTVGQCAATLACSIQTASAHLQILHRAHIVESSKEGLQVFYNLKKPLSPLVRSALSLL